MRPVFRFLAQKTRKFVRAPMLGGPLNSAYVVEVLGRGVKALSADRGYVPSVQVAGGC